MISEKDRKDRKVCTNCVHPWHDVGLGKKAPEVINAIIEIPKDSSIKYELDKETGLMKLDRFLYSAVHYPGDYGFVPQTLWDDNDPLDIIIITGRSLLPGIMAQVRVIGVARMVDDKEKDDKIIAVYDQDPRFNEIQNVTDLGEHHLRELKHFFEKYKELQGRKCEIQMILGKKSAIRDIERAQKMYQEKFGTSKTKKSLKKKAKEIKKKK